MGNATRSFCLRSPFKHGLTHHSCCLLNPHLCLPKFRWLTSHPKIPARIPLILHKIPVLLLETHIFSKFPFSQTKFRLIRPTNPEVNLPTGTCCQDSECRCVTRAAGHHGSPLRKRWRKRPELRWENHGKTMDIIGYHV